MFAVGGIVAEYKYDNEDLFAQLESAKTEEERKEVVGIIYLNNVGIIHKAVGKWFPGEALTRFCQRHRLTPEDVFSEVSYSLLRAIQTFKEGKFTSYAGFCMDNQLKMLYRTVKRKGDMTSLQSEVNEESDNDKKSLTIEEAFLSAEDKGYSALWDTEEFNTIVPHLKRCFRRGNEAKVLTIFLKEVQKDAGDMMSQKEMAEVIGVSKSTVNKTVTKINKQAREIRRELYESELQRQTS
jgi:RNA polymerase sigma factor (sigma-70 family)